MRKIFISASGVEGSSARDSTLRATLREVLLETQTTQSKNIFNESIVIFSFPTVGLCYWYSLAEGRVYEDILHKAHDLIF